MPPTSTTPTGPRASRRAFRSRAGGRDLCPRSTVQVRDRSQFDLMLLSIVSQQPGNGYAVATTLHDQTGGRVAVSTRVVFTSLHRLTRNRLVRRTNQGGYMRTQAGTRSIAAKRREWQILNDAMQSMLPVRVA
jgi:DNA-binding PadR family transcriptional regulator